MYTQTIINPATNRKNSVKCWDVETSRITQILKSGGNAKDISWMLLEESVDEMEATQYGDSSRNNFALNVFENALDWGLGIAAVNFLKACKAQHGKYPARFTLAANRNGDVFYISKSGSVVKLSL